jgi:hypothetical protein
LERLIEDFVQSLAVIVLCTVEHVATTIESDNITGTGNGLSVYRERERRDMDRDRDRDRDRQRETDTETVSDRDRQNRDRDRNRDRATEDIKMNRYRASERSTERYREIRVKSKSTFSALSFVCSSCRSSVGSQSSVWVQMNATFPYCPSINNRLLKYLQ